MKTFYSFPEKVRLIFTVLFIFTCSQPLLSQVVYNETFDTPVNTFTLPLGWVQGKYGPSTDPFNYWDRRVSSTAPAASPRTGSAMARFNSETCSAGESSYLVTKRLDMRNMPAGGAGISFWMYRDNGWGGIPDRVQVYVNSTPDMNGTPSGPLAEITSTATAINRNCSLTPVASSCNAWNQYSYNIPLASGFNTADCYVIIVAISGSGNDILIDDFSINTWPQNQVYSTNSAVVYYQQTYPIGYLTIVNQDIITCRVTMNGAASPRTLTNVQFNTNGSTNPVADILNAKLWFTGGTQYFSTENAILLGTYNQPWLTNDTFLIAPGPNYSGMASFNGLEHGDNYFWLTYDINPAPVLYDYVDAEWINLNISGTGNIIPSPYSLNGSRLIYHIVYGNPNYVWGCFFGQTPQDFINSVTLTGNNTPPPGISNNMNTVNNYAGPACPPPYPRLCPWQSHPPDYEFFPEVSGKTTTLTADNLTIYPVSLQPGADFFGNSVAAWIDYNVDGIFNNWFYEVSINATGASGSNVITLSGVTVHPGWKVGMNVSGTGIAPGATVVNINSTTVTLSANNIGAVSGSILFSAPDGEKISQSPFLTSYTIYTTNFRVPLAATLGKTRMRVRQTWLTGNLHPTNTYSYGEAEDYIVTIVPDCPVYPGYTTWMGITDDWNDPANWCPTIAPISVNPTVNVRIPGGPTGSYSNNHPRIKAGVLAKANKLRIESNDTLFIDATTASSLTVMDSLKIESNTSAIIINTTCADTAQIYNGLLTRPVDSPLNSSARSRSFWLFSQTELSAKGLNTNDLITNIKLHLQRKSNGSPYKNVTVLMYYCAPGFSFTPGGAGTPPVPLTTPVTVWSGDLNTSSFIAALNSFGTIDLLLSNPFTWSGSVNQLVVEMCYDNTGFPATGADDEMHYTQTGNFRKYMCVESISTYPKAGCLIIPGDFSVITSSGTSGLNTVTVNAAQAGLIYPGQLAVGTGIPGLQVVSIAGNVVTMNGNCMATFTNTSVTFYNTTNTASIYRPNLTFKFNRYYIKYPVSVGGHWENNGTFVPAVSRVTMNGAGLNQQIKGNSNTIFYDLSISNINHVLRMTDFTVTDSLQLVIGRLKLNNGLVTISNPFPSAITRTNGFIQAETDAITGNVFPFGRIRWIMGTTGGIHTIPFANTANSPLFMDYNPDSGSHDVIFATYATLPNNTNLPLPEVTNVFGYDGVSWNSNGSTLVDRFFMIKDSLGVSPQADISLRYAQTERASINVSGALNMSAQRWINSSDRWEFPFVPGQIYAAGPPDMVSISNFSGFSSGFWWAIVGSSTPLPITIVDFTAKPLKDKVHLKWTTASEINCNYFDIERTVNHTDFDFISRTESKGPGTNLLDYESWDFHPVEGIQYYYLRQYDLDGSMESFGPVMAKFTNDLFEIVTTIISDSKNQVSVLFNYDSDQPVNVRIVDMTGRIVVSEDHHEVTPGSNIIEINTPFSQGCYQLILQNGAKTVSRKLFY